MAKIPLTPTDPDLLASLPNYAAGSAQTFATLLQTNQDALENRDRETIAALEQLARIIGYGAVTGGAISAGIGLSVNVAALEAVVGTWVGFDASQVVGGLGNALNYIYLRQDWTWTVNTTGTLPTSADGHGAALLWGTATASAGSVTVISNDRRTFAQNLSMVPLLTADPTSPVDGDMWGRTDTSTIHVQGLGIFSIGGGGGGGTGNMVYRGAYNGATAYVLNDVVLQGSIAYIAIGSTTGNAPPNATFWTPLGTAGVAGPTGPTGPQGPAGAQGFTWRGAWSSATTYAAYDVVSYNGSTYVATAAGTNQNPASATSFWNLSASVGAPGAAGATGATGAPGSALLPTTGQPSNAIGNNGDWAIDAAAADIYQKVSGTWGLVGNWRGAQGTQGIQGPQGPAGAAGGGGGGGTGNVNYLGDYDNTHSYAINDAVTSGGSSYIAVAPTLGHAPPNVSYWKAFAVGQTGPSGPAGSAGPTGPAGAAGPTGPAGSVASVGLSLPAELTVTGSPITTTGTLTALWATQAANLIFAGPASGAAAAPTFRVPVAADIPALPESKITNLVTDLAAKEATANKGVANGYAGLDSAGLVPVAQLPSLYVAEVPAGTVNGSNAAFTLSGTPTTGTDQVYLNGLLQKGGGNDYTLSGVTVTFTTAPATGSLLFASYIKRAGAVAATIAFGMDPAIVADNATDMTATITASLAAIGAAGGGTLVLPRGLIKCNSAITWPAYNGVSMVGQGREVTTLQFSLSTTGGIVYNTATRIYHCWLRDMSIHGAGATSGIGLDLADWDSGGFDRMRIYSWDTCVKLTSTATRGALRNGFLDCIISNGATNGVWLTGAQGPHETYFERGQISVNTTGLRIDNPGFAALTDDTTVWRTQMETNTTAIRTNGVRSRFSPRFEGNTTDLYFDTNAAYNLVETGYIDKAKITDVSTGAGIGTNRILAYGPAAGITEYLTPLCIPSDPTFLSLVGTAFGANTAISHLFTAQKYVRKVTQASVYVTTNGGGTGTIDIAITDGGGTVIASTGSTTMVAASARQDITFKVSGTPTPVYLYPERNYFITVAITVATDAIAAITGTAAGYNLAQVVAPGGMSKLKVLTGLPIAAQNPISGASSTFIVPAVILS